jgi:carboxypeptidase family protein
MRFCSVVLLSAALFASCIARGSVGIAPGDRPAVTGGTISGMVRAASDNTPLSGRKVTITNLETGEKLESSTAVNGGYTIKVPQGNYRIEVELRPGEVLASKPDDVHITRSDLDAGRNFSIAMKAGGR